MDSNKNYVRIEGTFYVEVAPGEGLDEAEERFLSALPCGVDCVNYKSEMYVPEEE